MIKFFNRYFPIIMLMFILSTTYLYKTKVNNFINNSVEHTIVISSDLSEQNKTEIKRKLKNMTHQDVIMNEKDDCIYVKIKCPPEDFSFFSKLICDRNWFNKKD